MIKATSSAARAIWAGLLAMTLALHLVTPTGFMPLLTSEGPVIVLCGVGQVVHNGPISATHHGGKSEQPDSADSLCPFAAAANDVAHGPLPTVTGEPAVLDGDMSHQAIAANSPGGGIAAPPPPPTGPPALL